LASSHACETEEKTTANDLVNEDLIWFDFDFNLKPVGNAVLPWQRRM